MRRCRAGQVCVPVRDGALSLLFMQVRLPFSASWPRCRSRVVSSSSDGLIRLRRSRCLVWTAPLADRFPSCRQRFVVVATLTISDDRRAEVVLDQPLTYHALEPTYHAVAPDESRISGQLLVVARYMSVVPRDMWGVVGG